MKKEIVHLPSDPEPGDPLSPWQLQYLDEMDVDEVVYRAFAGCTQDPLYCDHCGKEITPGPDTHYWRIWDDDQHVAAEVTDEIQDEFYGCSEACANELMLSIPNMPDLPPN